jgi:hypothetical protein
VPEPIATLMDVLACEQHDKYTSISFRGDDGRQYDLRLSLDAHRRLLRELQIEAARGARADLLTLNVTGVAPILSADSAALLLRTHELGSIAVIMTQELIDGIGRQLAELEMVLRSPGSPH